MTEPTVALVFSPDVWVERLHRHLTDHGGGRVRQIVLDPALALEESYDVLVVSHQWPGLTQRLVTAVSQRGRVVLGVYDPEEAASQGYLASLGVHGSVAADASMDEFVGALERLHSDPVRGLRGPDATHPSGPAARGGAAPRGILVVAGLPGAGATETALGIAYASARSRSTVLVDAHERTPSLAARLGLPVEPGLLAAIDAVERATGRLDDAVSRVAPGLGVVPGTAGAASMVTVDPHELVKFLEELAHGGNAVVVDVASDADASSVRGVFGVAAAVVFVARATPIGVARTISWVAEQRGVVDALTLRVVLNHAPRDRFRRRELEHELVRTAGVAGVSFVPNDPRVEDAVWDGTVVRRGAFADATARAVEALVARRPQSVRGPVVRGAPTRRAAGRRAGWAA